MKPSLFKEFTTSESDTINSLVRGTPQWAYIDLIYKHTRREFSLCEIAFLPQNDVRVALGVNFTLITLLSLMLKLCVCTNSVDDKNGVNVRTISEKSIYLHVAIIAGQAVTISDRCSTVVP